MTKGSDDRSGGSDQAAPSDPLKLIGEALARLRFGGIHLTVHEGKLVQIEVTEKRRFT